MGEQSYFLTECLFLVNLVNLVGRALQSLQESNPRGSRRGGDGEGLTLEGQVQTE